jgi:hypothetical protein
VDEIYEGIAFVNKSESATHAEDSQIEPPSLVFTVRSKFPKPLTVKKRTPLPVVESIEPSAVFKTRKNWQLRFPVNITA